MKKLKQIFTFIIISLSIFPVLVFAVESGGTGESGGQSNTGEGGRAECYYFSQFDPASEHINTGSGYKTVSAYKFDLVYRTKGGGREILKSVVTYDTNSVKNNDWYTYRIPAAIQNYVAALKATYGNDKVGNLITSGGDNTLFGLANKLSKGDTIDNLFRDKNNEVKLTNYRLIKNYITSTDGFNISAKDLQRPQDINPGNINSYGYRILIQKIQFYDTCDDVVNTGFDMPGDAALAAPRKEAANDFSTLMKNLKNRVANNKYKNDVVNHYPIKMSAIYHVGSTELWTTRDDIGIYKASDSDINILKGNNGEAIRNLKDKFADENNGLGYNILWFATDAFASDYSIDAACVNCNSKISDNKSYFIQDTTNWTAIKNSKGYLEGSNEDYAKNVRKYFYKKENGFPDTYCREEYTVNFPNANNTIQVATGRYFLLNASDDDEKKYSAIPNFKPISVTKTRICKGGDLEKFKNKSENSFKNVGKVYFKYIENYKNSKYTMSQKQELKANNDSKVTSTINGDTLTMSITKTYTLPTDFYRYVRKKDGLSVKQITNDQKDSGEYEDIGISNLPVSFNNHSSYAGDVKLSYELPSHADDPYTYIKDAYEAGNGANNYFKSKNNEFNNIYKKYSNNQTMTEEEKSDLTQSACAKMYGYGTSEFNECAKKRQTNKIGDTGSNCYTINKQIDSDQSTSGYSCIVSSPNKCRYDKSTGKFYNSAGKEISETDYNNGKCDSDDGGTCKIVYNHETNSTDYYGPNGEKISKDEYNTLCPCPNSCKHGCCPSGECAPMPRKNGMIVCPVGGKRVIYRTIDLIQPFPGQSSSNRATGSNWCSYDVKTQKIDCKWNNKVSQTYILNEGKKIHSDNHILYQVTLDSKTISTIRNYNKKHKYDDFTLKCKNNGKACISTFLKEVVSTTGKCANKSTASQFDSCNS